MAITKVKAKKKRTSNPLVTSPTGWIKAKAIKIVRGKLLIKR